MRRNGEDIIITNSGEMAQAKALASKVSHSRSRAWCHVFHIDPMTRKLTRLTYAEGRPYVVTTNAQLNMGNWWFSVGKRRGLTILDAMVRYGSGWPKAQAERLGGTGRYSNIEGGSRTGIKTY